MCAQYGIQLMLSHDIRASTLALCHTTCSMYRYSPEQLYDVVSKVENYKVGNGCPLHASSVAKCTPGQQHGLIMHRCTQDFVPWCERSTVLQKRDDSYMEAELEVGFKVFVER